MLLDNVEPFHRELFLGRATDVGALMVWMRICGWVLRPALWSRGPVTLMLQEHITHVCLEPRTS